MPNINPRIRSLDDLLGVARKVENTAATEDKPAQPGNNEIQMLPPEIIRGFRGHPFRLYEGDRFNDLVDSVSENGVLSPTIIRKIEPDENGFKCWPVITAKMLLLRRSAYFPVSLKRIFPIRTHGFMSLKPMSCNGPSRKCSRLNGRLCWPCATPR